MSRIGIIGVGHSKFGKRSDASLRELAFEAYSSALDDADIESSKIDGSVVCSATHYDKQRSPAGVVAEYLGLNPQPTFNVEAACASSAVGLRTAWALVSSKLHDVVAVVGVQKMTELSSEEIQELMGRAGDVMWESPFGTTMPAYYAMYATAHMAKYGTTEEKMARVGPNDVDVAEVHDSFSITEILNYEDLGFAKPGGGTRLLEKEETELGGKIPVNTDGGLISKGHPVGATGASQLFALTKQLRGEAGSTQVDGAKIGLAQNIGGIGMYCSVTILRS